MQKSEDNRPLMVSIRCATYNHANYIRQCLDGFVMQKTNFRFEAIVHDDASTDGTTEVVREYAEKYPDIIKPMYEVENQYSRNLAEMNKRINDRLVGKYIAICEGDDYWIDPLKLQKQVDYLEEHPECTMTCNRTKLYSERDKAFIGEQYCLNENGTLRAEDAINRTGLYVPTCSILYRRQILDAYPDYCKKCLVGDYPLQIFCAMKGYIYYFNDAMSVYRRFNSNSWVGQQEWGKFSMKRIEIVKSRVKMLRGFMCENSTYRKVFEDKISDEINRNVPYRQTPKEDVGKYLSYFADDINNYSLRWRFDLMIRKCRIPKIRYWYTKYFLKKYTYLQTLYK